MLVLSRHLNQVIEVSGEGRCRIKVLGFDLQRGTVKLGFEADDSIEILREEAKCRIRKHDEP